MSRIFIGHGRSLDWVLLQRFLTEKLGLPCSDFESDSNAGKSIPERIDEMVNEACFAFLVMTAEDTHSDDSQHARENVIHEIGLFQGRLGRKRAIVLLEEGCTIFSNLQGLIQLRYPKNDILARSEQIRDVLLREQMLDKESGKGLSRTPSITKVQGDEDSNYAYHEGMYWSVRGNEILDGPFCSRCRDVSEKNIHLRETFISGIADMSDVKYGGHRWYCPICNDNIDRNPAHILKAGQALPSQT